MAHIESFVQDNIRFIQVRGVLGQGAIVDTIRRLYPTLSEPFILWDLREAQMPDVSLDHLRQIASLAGPARRPPGGAKTAYVASDPTVFALVCMYAAEVTMTQTQVIYSAFRQIDDAIQWFNE